LVDHW